MRLMLLMTRFKQHRAETRLYLCQLDVRQLRLPQTPADSILLQFDVLRVPKIHQHMAWP